MTESERVADWIAFFAASPAGYHMNALLAVLENDGERVLGLVLKKLSLESSSALILECKKRGA